MPHDLSFGSPNHVNVVIAITILALALAILGLAFSRK
jgi:hypothetical protein